MFRRFSPHTAAVLQALFVTLLWATSWVLIKFGLGDIPPLTFAGLRYTTAFLCLLPFALRGEHRRALQKLAHRDWIALLGLGMLAYAVAQGAQFIALAYLPAITTNLLLSFTTVVVTLLGIALLREQPTWFQWTGMGLYLVGVMIYFVPVLWSEGQFFGVLMALVCLLANAIAGIIGRNVNRSAHLHPLVVTVPSMGIGALLMLLTGIAMQGLPPISLQNWGIILWLAVINTAFAFTLWNHTLRTLSAMEASMINSTMLIHIPILALLFLGEAITVKEGIGMVLAGIGILAVQMKGMPRWRRREMPVVETHG